jgi:hypothetical protein
MNHFLPYPRGDLIDFIENQPEDFIQILQDETIDLLGLWQNLNDGLISVILKSTASIGKTDEAIEHILYRSFTDPPHMFHPRDQADVQLSFVSTLLKHNIQISDFYIKEFCFVPCIIYLGCLNYNSFHVLLEDILEKDHEFVDIYRHHFFNPGPLLRPATKTDRWKFCKNLIVLRKDFHASSHQRINATMEMMEVNLDPAAKTKVIFESERIFEITGVDMKKILQ